VSVRGALAILSGVAAAGCGKDAPPPPAAHPVDVAVTDANTAVVMSDGAVLVWGHAKRGAVGWLDRRDVAVPVRAELPPAQEIVAGGFDRSSTFCARAGTDWWCWGDRGRVPIGGVVRWEKYAAERDRVLAPARIDGFAGVKVLRFGAMKDGAQRTGCAILADDSLACWRVDWSDPFPAPGPVADVRIGERHACALARDGRVWCWGNNTYGAVDGTVHPEVELVWEPRPVPGIAGATAIAVGFDLSCARLAGDRLACWGGTFYGNGIAQLAALPSSTLFTGGADICELPPDGVVRCLDHSPAYSCPTGLDVRGAPCQKGVTGHAIDAPPLRSLDAAPAKRVAWGREHACSITMADALSCNGTNDHGELGDGTLVDHRDAVVVKGLVAPPAAPPEPVAAARARRAMRWDQAPPGCEHDAAFEGIPLPMKVVSAWASADAALIVLRDYASSVSDDDLRGDEHELKLSLTLPSGFTTGTAAIAMPYDPASLSGPNPVARKDPTAMAVLRSSAGDVAWFGGEPDSGTVTIGVHDDRWVCGEIDARGGGATLRGRFAAEVAP
jgi:hypothetical protein